MPDHATPDHATPDRATAHESSRATAPTMAQPEPGVRNGIDRTANDAAVAAALGGGGAVDEATHAVPSLPGVDPVTGEVRGTGSGTGGGNPGEDYDDDHTAGSNSVR